MRNLLEVRRGNNWLEPYGISRHVWRHITAVLNLSILSLFRRTSDSACVPSIGWCGVMKPTVTATASCWKVRNKAVNCCYKKKKKTIKITEILGFRCMLVRQGREPMTNVTRSHAVVRNPSDEEALWRRKWCRKFAAMSVSFNFRNSVKEWMRVRFVVARRYCVDTLRTFLVLVGFGASGFGISVSMVFSIHLRFGLHDTLIFIWLRLPIFSAVSSEDTEEDASTGHRTNEWLWGYFFLWNRYYVSGVLWLMGLSDATVPSVTKLYSTRRWWWIWIKSNQYFSNTTASVWCIHLKVQEWWWMVWAMQRDEWLKACLDR
jgi:hypothetical protein